MQSRRVGHAPPPVLWRGRRQAVTATGTGPRGRQGASRAGPGPGAERGAARTGVANADSAEEREATPDGGATPPHASGEGVVPGVEHRAGLRRGRPASPGAARQVLSGWRALLGRAC
jgi:hypothetical protein